MSSSGTRLLRITLDARPRPIEVPLSKTAVLVVDMQNDYGSVGGLFERNGIDISGIRELIAPIAQVLAHARRAGVPVVYTKAALRPDFSDLFQPGSPLRDRWLAYGAGAPVQAPDGRPSRVLIRDTWNTDVIDELKPESGDIEVYKHGYSAFHETELDAVLKGLGVKYLIITGCTTSVCVESTIRDGHSRDYYCILLEDCTAEPIGHSADGYIGVPGGIRGGSNYEATLLLIQTIFGWVSNSKSAIQALAAEPDPVLTRRLKP
jgi:ureidoacrylate peracid hydrolase